MKSAVRRILLMSALMSPNALFALGLGEIHLNSALNQPFDADIDLVSAADEDLSALRASLASGDTFTRYGLDKPAYLADFTFRVVRGPNGQDVLKVTSPKPVTEPFVTLLVRRTGRVGVCCASTRCYSTRPSTPRPPGLRPSRLPLQG